MEFGQFISIPVIIVEPLTSILGLALSFNLWRRYQNKKLPATLNLFFFIFLSSLAIVLAAIGRVLSFTSAVSTHPYSVSAFLINVFALLALVRFSNLAFQAVSARLNQIVIILAVINVISLVFHLAYDPFNNLDTWIFHEIVYIVLALLCYGIVYREARKTYSTTTNENWKKGVIAIAWAQIVSVLVFVFFILDIAIAIVLGTPTDFYSYFWFVAYACILAALFLSYIGYTLPKWYIGSASPS